jgi:hypothetical protein
MKESIDAAVKECGGPLHALFLCAGVADGTPGIEKINFIGHRHLIDRMLDADALPRGSAIGFISSAAGLGWESNLELVCEYLDTPDFDSAVEWIAEHGKADYMWSKQAICAYVSRQAYPSAQARHPHQRHLPGSHRHARWPRPTRSCGWHSGRTIASDAGIEASTPLEQAYPLVFLCSDAASALSGEIRDLRCRLHQLRPHQFVSRRRPGRQFLTGRLAVSGGTLTRRAGDRQAQRTALPQRG